MDKSNNANAAPDAGIEDSRLSEAIQTWMVVRLSEELKIAPEELDIRAPLLGYGLDSIVAFSLTGELADWLGWDLPSTLFWDWPTIEALAIHLAHEVKDGNVRESLLDELNQAVSKVEEQDEIVESDSPNGTQSKAS